MVTALTTQQQKTINELIQSVKEELMILGTVSPAVQILQHFLVAHLTRSRRAQRYYIRHQQSNLPVMGLVFMMGVMPKWRALITKIWQTFQPNSLEISIDAYKLSIQKWIIVK